MYAPGKSRIKEGSCVLLWVVCKERSKLQARRHGDISRLLPMYRRLSRGSWLVGEANPVPYGSNRRRVFLDICRRICTLCCATTSQNSAVRSEVSGALSDLTSET